MKSILSVAVSRSGRFAAAGRTNQVVIYDLTTGRESARLVDPSLSSIQYEGRPMYPGGAADRDMIHALAISPDETHIAAGGYRAIRLWKRPQSVQKKSIALPAAVTASAASRDGATLAVATADKQVRLVSLVDGKIIREWVGAAEPLTALEFAADGKTLYGVSSDKTLRSWTVADGKPALNLSATSALSAIALNKDGSQVLTAGADGVIRVWPTSGKPAAPIREIKGHEKAVNALALLLPAGTHVVSGSDDGTARVCEIATGKQTLKVDHGGPVAAVAVRPDGLAIASAGANKLSRVWQLSDGKKLAELKGTLAAQRALVLANEAQSVAAQDVTLADARIKAAEQDVKDREETVKKSTEGLTAAEKALAEAKTKEKPAIDAAAAAKKTLAAKPADAALKKASEDADKAEIAAKDTVKSATAGVGSAQRAKESAAKALTAAVGRQAARKTEKEKIEAASKAKQAAAASAATSAAQAESPILSIAFTADGKQLATASADQNVQLWETATGKPLESFSGEKSPLKAVYAMPNGSLISIAEKSITEWDTNPAWTLVGRIGPKADAPLELGGSPFVSRILALDFSEDGKLLAAGGGEPSRSGELSVWSIPELKLVRQFKDPHSDTVLGVDISRDGQQLATAGADKFVKVFDLTTGKLARSFEGHTHHVLDVSWKADGSTLASAGADNQVKVWNIESGEQVRTLAGFQKQVTSVQFIGTGENIVSSGGDKTVRLFRTADGNNYRTLAGASDFLYSAAASRDESLVVAGGEDGVLRVWNGANGQIVHSFPPPAPPTQANARR